MHNLLVMNTKLHFDNKPCLIRRQIIYAMNPEKCEFCSNFNKIHKKLFLN